MKLLKIAFLSCFFSCWALLLWGQVATVHPDGFYQIYSEILKEKRTYYLSLPDSYEADEFYKNKSYPVMIVLDGATHFDLVNSMVKSMASDIRGNERIPEMIVIGVNNLGNSKNRDFSPSKSNLGPNGEVRSSLTDTGGAAKFRQFLEKELLVEIDRHYRTLDYRLLIGHSLAGLFALDAMLEQAAFNAYLAIDPSIWWENLFIVKKAAKLLEKEVPLSSQLYLGKANNPFNEDVQQSTNEASLQTLVAHLKRFSEGKFSYKYHFFEKEDHFSIPLISIYKGLLFIFEEYNFPIAELKKLEAGDLSKHYADFNEKRATNMLPPGKWLDFVGNYLLGQGEVDIAIKLFEFCTTNYPNSYVPYNSLALAYLQKKELAKAKHYFEQALQIAPEQESIVNRLKEINP